MGFTTNPAVQPFLEFLASPEAAKALVSTPGSGFLSAEQERGAVCLPRHDLGGPGQADRQRRATTSASTCPTRPRRRSAARPNKGEWKDLQTFLSNGDVAAAQAQLEKDAAAAKGW